jgi:hypothetical protein
MLLKMQNQEIKNKVKIGSMTQIFKDEIFKSNFLKTTLYIGGGVVGLFALGIVFKAMHYTAYNFKLLSRTFKS